MFEEGRETNEKAVSVRAKDAATVHLPHEFDTIRMERRSTRSRRLHRLRKVLLLQDDRLIVAKDEGDWVAVRRSMTMM